MYNHLFFDLDHTIWDFEQNSKHTLHDLYNLHNLYQSVTPDFDAFHSRYSYHNKILWDKYHHGKILQEDLRWKRMYLAMIDFKNGNEALARQLSAEYLKLLPTKNQLFPGTIEVLDYLKSKNYIMHLITNGFEDVQYGKLKNSNITNYFNQVVTSEKAMSLKPHAEIFNYALKAANAQIGESIMIGDNLDADISGAMNIGMDTVFVNHINETTNLKPTYTVTNLFQLKDIF
jgi:putative hydrolase of the HAD superfamily